MKRSDLTILVADDDASLLKIYQKALSVEGYRLISVESCERVLAELNEKEANLLITDLKMSNLNKMADREKLDDMDSFEMFSILERNHPNLPIIVVSGSYEEPLAEFDKKGFTSVKAFFMKPLNMGVLKQKIREVLKTEDP